MQEMRQKNHRDKQQAQSNPGEAKGRPVKVDGHLACGHQEAACRLQQDNQGLELAPVPPVPSPTLSPGAWARTWPHEPLCLRPQATQSGHGAAGAENSWHLLFLRLRNNLVPMAGSAVPMKGWGWHPSCRQPRLGRALSGGTSLRQLPGARTRLEPSGAGGTGVDGSSLP